MSKSTILRPTMPDAAAAPRRHPLRSDAELRLRDAAERWGRARWPDARVIHELVMDKGTVRADMAFIGTDHFVALEIKSPYDMANRLIQQVAMFRVASPEVWVLAAQKHAFDAELVRYLFPTIGLLVPSHNLGREGLPEDFEVREAEPPGVFAPIPIAMLHLLWVSELAAEARYFRLWHGAASRPPTHATLVTLLLKKLSAAEITAAVCRQLRGRDAFWRADPPIIDGAP